MKNAKLEARTATRDFGRLVEIGLLEPRGATRGRHYDAAGELRELRVSVRASKAPLEDPYPGLMAELREP